MFRKILWQIGPHHNHKVTLEVSLEVSGRLGVPVVATHLKPSPAPDQTSVIPSHSSGGIVLYHMCGFHQNVELSKCKHRQSEEMKESSEPDPDMTEMLKPSQREDKGAVTNTLKTLMKKEAIR